MNLNYMQTPAKIQKLTVSSDMQYFQLIMLAIIAILSVLYFSLAILSVNFTTKPTSKIKLVINSE